MWISDARMPIAPASTTLKTFETYRALFSVMVLFNSLDTSASVTKRLTSPFMFSPDISTMPASLFVAPEISL